MQRFTRIAALLLVTVAIVLAVLAFSVGRRAARPLTHGALAPQTVDASSQGATTPVVVAATLLRAGSPLMASSLQVANLSQRPADAFGTVNAAVGEIPLVDIPAGTAITASLLARGVAMALKPGERAIAIPVDETTATGNRVLPGDYVDVFVSLKTPASMNFQPTAHDVMIDNSQARLLLSRLRVLAYGDDDLPPLSGAIAATSTADGKPASSGADGNSRQRSSPSKSQPSTRSLAHTAVLAVPVAEASQLLLAVQNGKLSLGVRSPGDTGQPDDSLFASPPPVLAARGDLSADQKQLLMQPENLAYAGINGSGLAGHDPVVVKRARVGTTRLPSAGIEIIRGSSIESERAVRANP